MHLHLARRESVSLNRTQGWVFKWTRAESGSVNILICWRQKPDLMSFLFLSPHTPQSHCCENVPPGAYLPQWEPKLLPHPHACFSGRRKNTAEIFSHLLQRRRWTVRPGPGGSLPSLNKGKPGLKSVARTQASETKNSSNSHRKISRVLHLIGIYSQIP